jgi:hypothetical protein
MNKKINKIILQDYKNKKIKKEFENEEEFFNYWEENYLPLEQQTHQIANIYFEDENLYITVLNDFNLNKELIKSDNSFQKAKLLFEDIKKKYRLSDLDMLKLLNEKEN